MYLMAHEDVDGKVVYTLKARSRFALHPQPPLSVPFKTRRRPRPTAPPRAPRTRRASRRTTSSRGCVIAPAASIAHASRASLLTAFPLPGADHAEEALQPAADAEGGAGVVRRATKESISEVSFADRAALIWRGRRLRVVADEAALRPAHPAAEEEASFCCKSDTACCSSIDDWSSWQRDQLCYEASAQT